MSSLGYGQTYQDVKASRVSGTTYYNTTGKPIAVFAGTASGGVTSASVNGVNTVPAAVGFTAVLIVPPGQSYSITLTTVSVWTELR
jgi:hypothetical protein